MNIELLEKVRNGGLSPRRAYRALYKKKRAHFYKFRIKINEAKHISRLINFFFLFPAPLFIVRLIINLSFKDIGKAELKLIKDTLKYLPASIAIDANKVKININAL